MPQKMTALGVAPRLALIVFPYLVFTMILHISRPDIFTITQIPYLACVVIGMMLIVGGGLLWASVARVIINAFDEGRLLTKGVYAIVRHPMYSGIVLFFFSGVALVFRSWAMLTVPLVGYIVFKYLIQEEENYLEEKFGQEYLDYRSKANAFIPFPRFSK